MNEDDYLENVFKDRMRLLYKEKFLKTSHDDMIEYFVKSDSENRVLTKIVETQKFQICVLNQKIIDLNSDITELAIFKNKFIIHQHQTTHIKHTTHDLPDTADCQLNNPLTDSNIERELSIYNETPPHSPVPEQFLQSENKRMKSDIMMLINEAKCIKEKIEEYEQTIEEKDNIIKVLYQEVDNMKNCAQANSSRSKENNIPLSSSMKSKTHSFSFSNSNNQVAPNEKKPDITQKCRLSHLEDLELIKSSLVEFLKNYGISEDFSKCSNTPKSDVECTFPDYSQRSDHMSAIELRMREIRYILVNLKKINIIFKSLCVDFTKNMMMTIENSVERMINTKLTRLESKFKKLCKIFLMNKK